MKSILTSPSAIATPLPVTPTSESTLVSTSKENSSPTQASTTEKEMETGAKETVTNSHPSEVESDSQYKELSVIVNEDMETSPTVGNEEEEEKTPKKKKTVLSPYGGYIAEFESKVASPIPLHHLEAQPIAPPPNLSRPAYGTKLNLRRYFMGLTPEARLEASNYVGSLIARYSSTEDLLNEEKKKVKDLEKIEKELKLKLDSIHSINSVQKTTIFNTKEQVKVWKHKYRRIEEDLVHQQDELTKLKLRNTEMKNALACISANAVMSDDDNDLLKRTERNKNLDIIRELKVALSKYEGNRIGENNTDETLLKEGESKEEQDNMSLGSHDLDVLSLSSNTSNVSGISKSPSRVNIKQKDEKQENVNENIANDDIQNALNPKSQKKEVWEPFIAEHIPVPKDIILALNKKEAENTYLTRNYELAKDEIRKWKRERDQYYLELNELKERIRNATIQAEVYEEKCKIAEARYERLLNSRSTERIYSSDEVYRLQEAALKAENERDDIQERLIEVRKEFDDYMFKSKMIYEEAVAAHHEERGPLKDKIRKLNYEVRKFRKKYFETVHELKSHEGEVEVERKKNRLLADLLYKSPLLAKGVITEAQIADCYTGKKVKPRPGTTDEMKDVLQNGLLSVHHPDYPKSNINQNSSSSDDNISLSNSLASCKSQRRGFDINYELSLHLQTYEKLKVCEGNMEKCKKDLEHETKLRISLEKDLFVLRKDQKTTKSNEEVLQEKNNLLTRQVDDFEKRYGALERFCSHLNKKLRKLENLSTESKTKVEKELDDKQNILPIGKAKDVKDVEEAVK